MSEEQQNASLLNGNMPFAITEAYRTARANLIFSIATSAKKIVVITSSNPTEGKSTTCANLAISLAEMGKRVLIIDADMRKPTIHRLFSLDNINGLSSIISRLVTADEAIKTNVRKNLDIITAGMIPPNPAELLASVFMDNFLKELSEYYEYILIDTPPVNVVMDSQLLNGIVSGILFVVREGETTHGDIQASLRQIELAKGRMLGFLKVGCVPKDKKRYYGKYKKYGK